MINVEREKLKICNNCISYQIINKFGKIIDVSNAYCSLTEFNKNELIETKFIYFDNPQIQVKLQKDEVYQGELKIFKSYGESIHTFVIISPIVEKNEKIGYMLIFKDIDDQKKLEELALKDALTNLYNRRYFNEKLSTEIEYAKKMKNKLAFLMADVDFFKKYNDSYGHQKGDEALIEVANSMKAVFMKKTDWAFRLGGEEFGILYHVKDKDEAVLQAEKLRLNISEKNIEHSQHPLKHLTISIGVLVVDFAIEMVDSNGFYSMADTALYEAKETGRNKVVLYANANDDEDDLEFF